MKIEEKKVYAKIVVEETKADKKEEKPKEQVIVNSTQDKSE